MRQALRVAKGHGTQNDFVLLPDADAEVPLTPALIAALCDRRAGLGGDGVLRVARTRALAAAGELPAGLDTSGAEWFMDYHNADGSTAEMCGNGIRVFVAYLLREGWARLGEGESIAVGTRAGVRSVRRDGELLAADLGPWRVDGGLSGVGGEPGGDPAAWVSIGGEPVPLPGLAVDVGNPHVVVAVPDAAALAAADLTAPPTVDPPRPDGVNVEVVVPQPPVGDTGHLHMRVHERGVGETRSCGTGAVAAVLAARVWGGELAPDEWLVDVPGGRLRVRTPSGDTRSGEWVELAGPAVVVADGVVNLPALGTFEAAAPLAV